MGEVVAGVLPDDAFAPQHAADPAVADPHGNDRNNVGQDEVNNVIAEGEKKRKKTFGYY